MSRRFILTLVTICFILAAAGIAVFFAKGYTISPSEKRIVGTGILTVSSKPDSASVFIDGHLTTATNATVSSLPPKKYTVKIIKEGFIPWEKEVEVKEGLVAEIKVTLFPAIPTMYPLTFTGVKNPILSPDGTKLGFIVPAGKKAGVWVWTLTQNQPIAFARSAEPHQIAKSEGGIDFSEARLRFSPDSKQIIASLPVNNFLLDSDTFNGEPRDITPLLETTLGSWSEDIKDKQSSRVLAIKNITARKVASDSALLKWSPDETKFLYTDKKDPKLDQEDQATSAANIKVVDDSLELKIYEIDTNKSYSLPKAKFYSWLPDSEHLVLVEEGTISIVDYDGSNKAIIYAGNFLDDFIFAWPDSSRLVIISSFPTPTASEPNLYGINLK